MYNNSDLKKINEYIIILKAIILYICFKVRYKYIHYVTVIFTFPSGRRDVSKTIKWIEWNILP